jgi:DNA primase
MSDIAEQIKDKIDLVAYIERHGVTLKKAGNYFKACCPFHAEKTPSFMVSADKQTWRCYGACATGGDLFEFAMKQNGWTFGEALEALAKEAGVTLPASSSPSESAAHLRGYALLKQAAELYAHQLTPTARAYLLQRGFSEVTIQHWQFGAAVSITAELLQLGYSEADLLRVGLLGKADDGRIFERFRQRVLFPIWDKRGRVVGFAARRLNEQDEPKYLNSPQSEWFDKSGLLYGWHLALPAIRQTGQIVLVEGYTDAITAHQAGYTNVVAQMGTALTPRQIELLASAKPRQIILALDGDAAGQAAAQRSINGLIALSADVRILTLTSGKDPDEVLRAGQWATELTRAEPLIDYVLRTRLPQLPPNAPPAQRTQAARALLPLLQTVEDQLLRTLYTDKLAQAVGIANALLQREIQPPPRVQLLEAASAVFTPRHLESYLLRAVTTDIRYFEQMSDYLRELQQDPLSADDFRTYRREAVAFLQAIQHGVAVQEFMRAQLGAWSLLPDAEPLTQATVLQVLRRLRLQRLMREIDECIEMGDLPAAHSRVQQKAKLLTAMKKK